MGSNYKWQKWSMAAVLGVAGLITTQLPARTVRPSTNAAQKPAAPAAKAAAEYVGMDTCKTCHADVDKQWESTPHYKMLQFKQKSKQGCEGCHGPGSIHVASGGQTPVPYDFPKMTEQAISERCLACHQSRHENMEFMTSVHFRQGVGCTDCHSIHQSTDRETLLAKPQPELCYGCHREIQPLLRMPFHHRVNEGMVRCTDCHNPHGALASASIEPGGQNKQLRSSPQGTAVCTTCHVDKAGPFVFEHEPVVTDGCLDCHVPHGSPNPHMLKVANVNQLCLQCHTGSTVSNAPGIPSFHNQTTQFQSCTLCHTQIHGSNFSPDFFK